MVNRSPANAITALISAARRGDEGAFSQLYESLYRDLRLLAHAQLRAHDRITMLETTALVHESFMRLAATGQVAPSDRNHFLAYSARVMRSIIVDFVRRAHAQRRGGQQCRVTLDTSIEDIADSRDADLLRISEALEELTSVDPRAARVVEMRYFAGMADTEIANVLDVTERTVQRDWAKAKLLLQAALA